MREKRRYRTKQQEQIKTLLEKQGTQFYSVDQLAEQLKKEGTQVGHTTVYRLLERLSEEGSVLKVPSMDGHPAQYRYLAGQEGSVGKLVCIACGRMIPLECGCIDQFSEHIQKAHQFLLSRQYAVLYGYCENCR